MLYYENGSESVLYYDYDTNEESSNLVYSNGSGTFTIIDGYMYWTDEIKTQVRNVFSNT